MTAIRALTQFLQFLNRARIGFLILAVLACGGCASRTPLRSLPQADYANLRVEVRSGDPLLVAESAQGSNARRGSATGGLVGLSVAKIIAASTSGDSKALLHQLRQQTASREAITLEQAVREQLLKVGMSQREVGEQHVLTLHLEAIRLEELQRGFWRVGLEVTGTLYNAAQKTLWSVAVKGSGPTLRSLAEYAQQPQLYTEDFRAAAEDASRQLVAGPIRK